MIKKILMVMIKILAIIFLALLLVYLYRVSQSFGYKTFADRSKDKPGSASVVEAVIHVSEGESLLSIGEKLEAKKIIENKWTFAISVRFMEGYKNIVPGDYPVLSSKKPSEILNILMNKEGSQ